LLHIFVLSVNFIKKNVRVYIIFIFIPPSSSSLHATFIKKKLMRKRQNWIGSSYSSIFTIVFQHVHNYNQFLSFLLLIPSQLIHSTQITTHPLLFIHSLMMLRALTWLVFIYQHEIHNFLKIARLNHKPLSYWTCQQPWMLVMVNFVKMFEYQDVINIQQAPSKWTRNLLNLEKLENAEERKSFIIHKRERNQATTITRIWE